MKVSIIIPCYNSEKYIEPCIKTYPNIEVIVINNGSTDSSSNIITQFINKEGVNIISQPNKEAAAARNTGLKHATGDFIQFLDSDDVLDPFKIETQINYYKNNFNQAILVFGRWTTLGKNITQIGNNQKSVWKYYKNPTDILNDFALNRCCLPPIVYLTPKSLIGKVGLWNENLSMNDDEDFLSRVLSATQSLHFCDNLISYYRSTPNSLSKRMSHKAALLQLQSQILIAEIMKKNPNPKTDEAIYKMLNESLKRLYPYYRKEKHLINYSHKSAIYPSLN